MWVTVYRQCMPVVHVHTIAILILHIFMHVQERVVVIIKDNMYNNNNLFDIVCEKVLWSMAN